MRRPPSDYLVKKGGNSDFSQLGGLEGRGYKEIFFMGLPRCVLCTHTKGFVNDTGRSVDGISGVVEGGQLPARQYSFLHDGASDVLGILNAIRDDGFTTGDPC